MGAIESCIIKNLYPQQVPHGPTIGMDQQHTKGGSPYHINERTIGYLQILEETEQKQRSEESQDFIGIRNEEERFPHRHRYLLSCTKKSAYDYTGY